MIILKAKVKMSEDDISLKEVDLTNKLHDEVVIIPRELEVVTLNHLDRYVDLEYEDLDNESEYNPEEVKLKLDTNLVAEMICKALDELLLNHKRSGCKCNG